MKLTKKEMNEILINYDIGKFKKFGKIKKDDVVSFGQIIETTKGKFFMKIFRKFDNTIKQSIVVSENLRKKGFPTYKIYLTKSKGLYLNYKSNKIVFYEFIPNIPQSWKNLNMKEIKDFGKTLAKFHKLTKKLKIKSSDSGTYEDIKKLIHKFYSRRKKFGKSTQKILEFMEKEIKLIKCPRNEYLTGYYSEFNPGHVIFKNNKVKYVIDWEIGRENAFFDYGGSMASCFSLDGKKLSHKKLKEFVKGYDKERPLSNWERHNLINALKFGILKYGVWGFIDLKTGKMVDSERKIDKTDLNKVNFLMNTDINKLFK